jgi:hypothetical protein
MASIETLPVDPMLIAIVENGPLPEYLVFVLTHYIRSYTDAPSPEALDKVTEWLTKLRDSGMPKTVLSGKVYDFFPLPLPKALQTIIDATDDFEPIMDYVYWHGIVDPLSNLSIDAFFEDE